MFLRFLLYLVDYLYFIKLYFSKFNFRNVSKYSYVSKPIESDFWVKTCVFGKKSVILHRNRK